MNKYEYAIKGNVIFRTDSILEDNMIEYIYPKNKIWSELTEEMESNNFFPTILDKVSEEEALQHALSIGASKENFYN